MTKPAAKKPTKPPAKANNAAKGNARSTTTKAPGKKKPTPPPPVANAKAKAKGAAATAAKSKGTPSDGAQRKATARSPDDEVHPSAKPVGTAATVVAAVKKALETSAAVNTAAPLKSTAKKHAKPTPIVNVDDVIVSRSNRERRPMQFFESGNDAMNSSATECSRPVEPAPTTPFKPAKAHSIKEKAEAPTAPVTRNNVKPDTGKAALVARPPEDGATRPPHPPPASPPHKKSKSEPVKAKGSKGGVAKGATVVPEQPALQTRPQPNATPTRRPPLSDDRDDTSCPPPPPKLPVHARPTAVANDTCRRRLEYDDDDNTKHNENQPPPTPSVVETIAKASTLTKHAKVAAAPPPAPTVVVTAFVDQYVDRFGVGFSLGHMDSEHVTKPHVATGFLFTDGSSAVIDAVGNLTYVNAHRHRFTIRNVTGKITIPERLQKKMQVLVCMRAAITAYFSTDPASPRDAVSAAPEVHRADPTWTCWERDLLPCAPGHLVDDQTSPVYCCSASVATHLRKAADGVAVDDHVHVTPRQFVLSQRSAPYPGKTYYCSDGTADVD